MTNLELGEWMKRQLGYPTRNVELTQAQLEDCVKFALKEVQPWFTSYYYLTLDLNGRTAIDLSQENVFEVTDVIKIPNNLSMTGSTSTVDDPFSYPYGTGVVGGYGLSMSTVYYSRLTNHDIHHVMSAYAQQYNQSFYTKLAQVLAQRTMGSLAPSLNFQFNRDSKMLFVDPGYPAANTVTLEYIPYLSDVSQIIDERYQRCAEDLALGQALIILSRVVGKYDVSNAPSRINFENYRTDSESLLQRARDELKRISRTTYITD